MLFATQTCTSFVTKKSNSTLLSCSLTQDQTAEPPIIITIIPSALIKEVGFIFPTVAKIVFFWACGPNAPSQSCGSSSYTFGNGSNSQRLPPDKFRMHRNGTALSRGRRRRGCTSGNSNPQTSHHTSRNSQTQLASSSRPRT